MIKFEVGKTYYTRSMCDHDCIFQYEIVGRTEKQITFLEDGKKVRKGVTAGWDGKAEICYPAGKFSMCPIISADKELKTENV